MKSHNVDDTTETILVSSNRMMNRPTYHPTDDLIAYAAQTGTNWDIWLTTIDGRQQQRLTTTPDMESNPLWSPDGKMLAYKVAPADGKYNLTSKNFLTFPEASETLRPDWIFLCKMVSTHTSCSSDK